MHLFALPKRQIFPYVLPSEPQTGALIFLQPIPGDTHAEIHEAILSLYGFFIFLSASNTKARAYCNTSEVEEAEEESKIVLPQHN